MKKTFIYSLVLFFFIALIYSSCSSNKPSFQKPRNGGRKVNASGKMGRGVK